MEKIKISKGFKTKLAGMPDLSVIQIPAPNTVAASAMDIPYIRPKLLVRKNDRVKTGSPLFCDKRDKSIQYVSPGTGIVREILFGERRRLSEVVIDLESRDEYLQFDPVSKSDLKNYSREALITRLKEGGVWQCLRQLPARDTADSGHVPPMIIVSLNGNDIFSPHPGVLLKERAAQFEFGLEILKQFSSRIIVAVRKSNLQSLGRIRNHITHTVPDTFPAWDPSVVLYHIKKTPAENSAWCIAVDHLVIMAEFLSVGRYPVDKLVTVTKSGEKYPHILSRQGAPINILAGTVPRDSLITTGQFNGRKVSLSSHMGFFENTLNIINNTHGENMFGFIRPGLDTPTLSRTFLSCFMDSPMQLDCTIHGEERACINCSYCENICPNDMMPSFIMKALQNDGMEEALQYGLMDCCRCGLCSYVCPSKIELTHILSNGMDYYYVGS